MVGDGVKEGDGAVWVAFAGGEAVSVGFAQAHISRADMAKDKRVKVHIPGFMLSPQVLVDQPAPQALTHHPQPGSAPVPCQGGSPGHHTPAMGSPQ